MTPHTPFYLFGMGDRSKLIYMGGNLYAYPSYEVRHHWDVTDERILAPEYTVELETATGAVRLWEDERGVWLEEGSKTECLAQSNLHLPSFAGHPWRDTLRILHHEILINIIDGLPVPNFFVYHKPWYRDSAMMTMVLKETDNLHLVRDWAAGLCELYDRNNKGNEESDNLGQLLYILATLGLTDHPLIPAAIEEAERRLENGVLTGSTDYAEHPIYQTKWYQLGLNALGRDGSHLHIPEVRDGYSYIFWMDGTIFPPDEAVYNDKYPYLWWARKHAMRQHVDPARLAPIYPISSETRASEAVYEDERTLFPDFADARHAAPHTWTAAEMFLYLTDLYGKGDC